MDRTRPGAARCRPPKRVSNDSDKPLEVNQNSWDFVVELRIQLNLSNDTQLQRATQFDDIPLANSSEDLPKSRSQGNSHGKSCYNLRLPTRINQRFSLKFNVLKGFLLDTIMKPQIVYSTFYKTYLSCGLNQSDQNGR